MREHKRNPTITGKVVAFLMVLVVISNVIIGAISYFIYRDRSIETRAVEAEHIAVAMAKRIDGDRFADIMRNLEKNDYWHEIKAYADELSSDFGTAYLYILDNQTEGEVVYFAEGTLYEPYDLGDTEAIEVYAPEMIEAVRNNKAVRTQPYPSGEYGDMVSGFAPILDSGGKVVGVVGVDFFFEDILAQVNSFGLSILAIASALLAVFALIATVIGRRFVGKPLTMLDHAAKRLSAGDTDIKIDIHTKSEIGRLSKSFNHMAAETGKQSAVLTALADGDLSMDVTPRGDKDELGHAMLTMTKSLNEIFYEIHQSSATVSSASRQLADDAQSIAQGSTEQAAAVEELSALANEVAVMSKNNAEDATRAVSVSDTIRRDAENGSRQMDNMLSAVRDIAEASHNISKVIKVIDDIAFQTNILALNAAVEAARAGQHGKGFAVVAEEVRALASKSAEAAKDTGELIADTVAKAELGAKIADETAASLTRIVDDVGESSRLLTGMASSSGEQNAAIGQINRSLDQVAQIIQQNSASAEQAAAAGTEMSGQAVLLEELVSRFKLKESQPQGPPGSLRYLR